VDLFHIRSITMSELTLKQQNILEVLKNAITNFNQSEQYLIKNDLSERCICAKFASYIEKALVDSPFSDYVVDVEYNRGYDSKDYASKKLDGKKIYADLIVHKRECDPNTGFDNLFCIEMKKEYVKPDLTSDLERLTIMTNQYRKFKYRAGFMIMVRADKKADIYELYIKESYYNKLDY